jgi:hypothetical protein
MRYDRRRVIPLILFLLAIAIFTIGAEVLRGYLLGEYNGLSFAQDPSWYFGTWELRKSYKFWDTLIYRIDIAGPYIFSILYLIISGISYFTNRDRKLISIMISSISTLLIGWLTFSNLYVQHSYYQLPVTMIIFISFATSLSYIIEYIVDKYGSFMGYKTKLSIPVIVVVFISNLILTQKYLRDTTYRLNAAKDMMKSIDRLLYVTNNFDGNPSFGAILDTKLESISSSKFENSCVENLIRYRAILSSYPSKCIERYKNLSSYYQHLPNGYILYIIDSNEAQLISIKDKKPYIKSSWDIYLNDKYITLYKNPCDRDDITDRFYFRYLSTKSYSDKFQNRDFTFDGIYRDHICLISKELPKFAISKIKIGQYRLDIDGINTPRYIYPWLKEIDME